MFENVFEASLSTYVVGLLHVIVKKQRDENFVEKSILRNFKTFLWLFWIFSWLKILAFFSFGPLNSHSFTLPANGFIKKPASKTLLECRNMEWEKRLHYIFDQKMKLQKVVVSVSIRFFYTSFKVYS